MTGFPSSSLAQRLADAAAANPTRRAIASMDSAINHAEFQVLIRSLALHLRARGIDQRARLGLVPDHPIVMLGLAMACSLLGCAWMSATPWTLANRQSRISHVLHLGARPEGATCPAIQVDPGWNMPPPGVREDFPGYASARDPWMIAHSSGTTGEPKLIPLTEIMFLDRIDGGHHVPHPPNLSLLCMFPLLSYANIINAVRTLAQGGTILYGDPAALYGKVQIDMLNGSPSQHATFMNALAPATLQAQGPRIGAARVTGATAGPAFYARLLRHAKQVVNVYSSTEAAVHCARIIDGSDLETAIQSVGSPVEGCVLEIVDADDRKLPAGGKALSACARPA